LNVFKTIAAFAALALLLLTGLGLIDTGIYGLTLFVLLPVAAGALAARLHPSPSPAKAAATGAAGVFAVLLFFLLLGREGLICRAMAAPLGLPLGALGGWLCHRSRSKPVAALLLFPATLAWDVHAPHPQYEVQTAIEIAASPEQVWQHVVAFPELPEPTDWFFRAGLAYPIRARIDGAGPGAIRYCEFSTGPFVEPIQIWQEPTLLRFSVTQNPPPMREWSPYSELAAAHLHGYFASTGGQFRLVRLPNNHTKLEGTTWYRHGLWPAPYWRWWSDAIIHRIHLRVLTHIRQLSEKKLN